MNSFFYKNNFFVKSKKYRFTPPFKLKLWFIFKNHYNHFLRKFIFQYVHLGTLSSHFIRAIICKNLTYQTRSKYRSKLFSTHSFNEWIYNVVKYNNKYFSTIIYLLYSATLNLTQPNSYRDDNFSICLNPTINIITHKNIYSQQINKFHQYNIINGFISSNYSNKDLSLLLQCNDLVEQYLTEVDPTKRVTLQIKILDAINNQQSIIFSRFFIFIDIHEKIYFIDIFLLYFNKFFKFK